MDWDKSTAEKFQDIHDAVNDDENPILDRPADDPDSEFGIYIDDITEADPDQILEEGVTIKKEKLEGTNGGTRSLGEEGDP